MAPAKGKQVVNNKRLQLAKKKKKRAKKKAQNASTFTPDLFPKGKLLSTSAVDKLDNEHAHYSIARGVELLHQIDPDDEYIDDEMAPTVHTDVLQKRFTKKRDNMIIRAAKRKTLAIKKYREELQRKRYRMDPFNFKYKYIAGYHRQRHRITKQRFLNCVDVDLFKKVLEANKELVDSPLWGEHISYSDISTERAELLKSHLYQFEVIIECLKDGLFDKPDYAIYPVDKLRRREKEEPEQVSRKDDDSLWDLSSRGDFEEKRKIDYPPVIRSDEDKNPVQEETGPGSKSLEKEKTHTESETLTVSSVARWLRSNPPPLSDIEAKASVKGDPGQANNPHGDLISIEVPPSRFEQKEFIKIMVEEKPKQNKTTTGNPVKDAKKMEEIVRTRHAKAEKRDPLLRLHPDNIDSEIESNFRSTTTDGYASWREPRVLKGGGTKAALLAHKVDSSLAWRIVLLMFVVYEILKFLKARIDDVYYGIYTSHLVRENIWLIMEPSFALFEVSPLDWIHFIISVLSSSIIYRENEPVSLLFAASKLVQDVTQLSYSFHDYMFLDSRMDTIAIVFLVLHCLYNVSVICLFIGYHYYTAGYIRKSREAHHRLSKLHNHEIRLKSSKGFQRRRQAWRWMQLHARTTNLKRLQKEYPNITDGNYPLEEIKDKIKFREPKELRIYAQRHNFVTGYPYNKIEDTRRYVYGPLEHSDYTDQDEREQLREQIQEAIDQIEKENSQVTQSKWKRFAEFGKKAPVKVKPTIEVKKSGLQKNDKQMILAATPEQKKILYDLRKRLVESGKLQ